MSGDSSSSSSEDERARRALLAGCAVVNVEPPKKVRSATQQPPKRASNRASNDAQAGENDGDVKLKQKAAKILDAYLNSQIDFSQDQHSASTPQPLRSSDTDRSRKGEYRFSHLYLRLRFVLIPF